MEKVGNSLMKQLGVGVIGVGFWGQNHARVYKELKKTKLVGISDLDKRKAEITAQTYQCDFFEKNEDLLKNEEIIPLSTFPSQVQTLDLYNNNKPSHVWV